MSSMDTVWSKTARFGKCSVAVSFNSDIAEQGSTILVSVNGVIYVIDGDYSWASDTNRLYALGTGAQYALGALQILAGNKKLQPLQAKSITLKAINVASKFDPHTGSPFHTFIQQTK